MSVDERKIDIGGLDEMSNDEFIRHVQTLTDILSRNNALTTSYRVAKRALLKASPRILALDPRDLPKIKSFWGKSKKGTPRRFATFQRRLRTMVNQPSATVTQRPVTDADVRPQAPEVAEGQLTDRFVEKKIQEQLPHPLVAEEEVASKASSSVPVAIEALRSNVPTAVPDSEFVEDAQDAKHEMIDLLKGDERKADKFLEMMNRQQDEKHLLPTDRESASVVLDTEPIPNDEQVDRLEQNLAEQGKLTAGMKEYFQFFRTNIGKKSLQRALVTLFEFLESKKNLSAKELEKAFLRAVNSVASSSGARSIMKDLLPRIIGTLDTASAAAPAPSGDGLVHSTTGEDVHDQDEAKGDTEPEKEVKIKFEEDEDGDQKVKEVDIVPVDKEEKKEIADKVGGTGLYHENTIVAEDDLFRIMFDRTDRYRPNAEEYWLNPMGKSMFMNDLRNLDDPYHEFATHRETANEILLEDDLRARKATMIAYDEAPIKHYEGAFNTVLPDDTGYRQSFGVMNLPSGDFNRMDNALSSGFGDDIKAKIDELVHLLRGVMSR